MKTTEQEAFDHFWTLVKRAEQEIRANCSSPTPANWGDPLDENDEAFLKAYKKVKPQLGKFRRKRLFVAPPGLLLRSGPYSAETAHEALMLFLLHPTDYESAHVLNSQEYRTITEEALKELKDRQEADDKSEARSKKTTEQQAKDESDLGTLFNVVRDHVLSVIRDDHPKPLTWKELSDRLPKDPKPWYQSRITRTMAKLLKAPQTKGMTAYRALFRDRDRLRGILTIDADGMANVDGVVEDSIPED